MSKRTAQNDVDEQWASVRTASGPARPTAVSVYRQHAACAATAPHTAQEALALVVLIIRRSHEGSCLSSWWRYQMLPQALGLPICWPTCSVARRVATGAKRQQPASKGRGGALEHRQRKRGKVFGGRHSAVNVDAPLLRGMATDPMATVPRSSRSSCPCDLVRALLQPWRRDGSNGPARPYLGQYSRQQSRSKERKAKIRPRQVRRAARSIRMTP